MIETARLKSAMPIALADCFAIATAKSHGVTLLTGDPEILDREVPCEVEDQRGAPSLLRGARNRGSDRRRDDPDGHRRVSPRPSVGRAGTAAPREHFVRERGESIPATGWALVESVEIAA